jgi:CHAT domain-containing protein/tetratricopeptide (TPR) repeat protein
MKTYFFCVIILLFSFEATAFKSSLVVSDTAKARLDFITGNNFLIGQRYDSALKYFQISLPAYESASLWEKVAACHNKIGECKVGMSDFKAAKVSAEAVLKICSEKLSSDHVQTGYARMILANISIYVESDLEFALAEYQKTLTVFRKTYGENHPDVAKVFISIAQTNSYFIGKYTMMLEYYQKALKILLTVKDKNLPEIANVYNSMGLVYREMGDYKTAEEYLNNALIIYKNTVGEKTLAVANCLGNIGRVHKFNGKYKEALACLESAKRIHQEVYHERHPFVVMVYRGMGDVYTEQRNIAKAEENYLKGIAIAEQLLNVKHTVLAAINNDLSELFLLDNNNEKALFYAQRALITNLIDFDDSNPAINPPANSYYCEIREFMMALSNKQNIFLNLYREKKNLDYAKLALQTVILSDTIVDELSKSYSAQNDKMRLGRNAARVAETGIEICFELYTALGDVQFLQKAFFYSERSRAGILTGAVADVKAKNFGGIPQDMLLFEKSLKQEKSKYLSVVQQEKMKGVKGDELKIGTANEQLFTIGRKTDSLTAIFEKSFPKYYQLKYQKSIASVADVQKKLDAETAFIEYYIGNRVAYAFVITDKTFNFTKLDSMPSIDKMVKNVRESLNPLKNKTRNTELNALYVEEASKLYTAVLKEPLSYTEGKTKLIIVPDGQLNYLPFGILLTADVDKNDLDFKKLPYLLNRFRISQGYSASLLFNEQEIKTNSVAPAFIAFAPEYKFSEIDSSVIADLGTFRSKLTALNWNQQEVNEISEFMRGVSLRGADALEREFKNRANQYSVIHLAMHALIDDERPMYSRLAFTLSSDTTEDGFLNAYELYNMELPAEMVVLSACETGFGKLERGEGIMSLAHAFTFAGCPSIVMSHWLADDKATATLMEYFYGNLAAGLPKDEALQKAKMDFLKQADEVRQNPAFWASFVVLGDTQPLRQLSFLQKYGMYIGGVAISIMTMVALVYFRRKRRFAIA